MQGKTMFVLGMILIAVLIMPGNAVYGAGAKSKAPAMIALQVSARSGTVELTKPDGTKLVITKDKPLPKVPSGTIIKAVTGVLVLDVGGSMFVIETGESLSIKVNKLGEYICTVVTGEINVVTPTKEKIILKPKSSLNTKTSKVMQTATTTPALEEVEVEAEASPVTP